MEQKKRVRGPSRACKDAEKYLKRNPHTSMRELAERFKIDPSTVSRQPWWKERKKEPQ